MFLHAWRLQFTHPATGKRLSLQADLPPDLKTLTPQNAQDALADHPLAVAP
jgi:23S rRNA pseudouridine955/2504/2580 synthase